MSLEERLALAQDRVSQKLGVVVQRDDDLVLLLAAFAHDQLGESSYHVPTIESLEDEARDWLEA